MNKAGACGTLEVYRAASCRANQQEETTLTRRSFLAVALICGAMRAAAAERARNVILFLGDAGGIPTLNIASAYAHGAPLKLFIHRMPHIALMDTSTAGEWVSDSAAGMTAIVTGEKTNNGVLSQSAQAVRGKSDGAPLKTILEYAEERGLSTGVITNMAVTDATPAACYAHSNDRRSAAEIFAQFLAPRFGDGVDVLIGAGRKTLLSAAEKLGLRVEEALRQRGYQVFDRPGPIPPEARRIAAIYDTGDFEPWPVVERTIEILSRNKKGYFLMVEWDMHTDNLKRGLDHAVQMDELVRRTAAKVGRDTLILFTADHSFDIRLRGGRKGEPLLAGDRSAGPENRPYIRVDGGHTGEEVLVAAQGPGAERVRGFLSNTDLFRIMMAAYGWKPAPAAR